MGRFATPLGQANLISAIVQPADGIVPAYWDPVTGVLTIKQIIAGPNIIITQTDTTITISSTGGPGPSPGPLALRIQILDPSPLSSVVEVPLGYAPGSILVSRNGVVIHEYSAMDGASIHLDTPIDINGEELVLIELLPGTGVTAHFDYIPILTPDDGQFVFELEAAFDPSTLLVFRNGVLISDWTLEAEDLVLGIPIEEAEELQVYIAQIVGASLETQLAGDSTEVEGGYEEGSLSVFRNGVLIQAFSATESPDVEFNTPLEEDEQIVYLVARSGD